MEAESSSSSSDFEPSPQTLSFIFQPKQEFQPLKAQKLFIGTYTLGSLYLYSLAQQSQFIGDINFDKKKQKPLASVYYNNEICTIRFNDTIQSFVDFDFTEFLFTKLLVKDQIQEIVILCDLTTDEPLNNNMFGLYTTKASQNQICPLLPRKFSLQSLEAQCMIYCQLNRIDGKCFVAKKDSYELDPKDVKKFESLNKVWPMLGTELDEKQYSEIIKQGGKKFQIISQMLYL